MWEYKVVYLQGDDSYYDHYDDDGHKVRQLLNDLGKEGWEMTGALIIEEVPVGYFKRPLSRRGEVS